MNTTRCLFICLARFVAQTLDLPPQASIAVAPRRNYPAGKSPSARRFSGLSAVRPHVATAEREKYDDNIKDEEAEAAASGARARASR
jgi:hypothetical protein